MSNKTSILIQIKRHSLPKYTVLREYLRLLEINPFEGARTQWLIDAFAGTGEVYRTWDRKAMRGSSLLMADFAKKVSNPPIRCVSVEANLSRFRQLEGVLGQYSPISECLCGDCNSDVVDMLNKLSNDEFAFIFFDPDGLGNPPLRYATVKKALAHEKVEILLNFQWRSGLLRVLGTRMPGAMATISNFIGTDAWKNIMKQRLPAEQKTRQILKLYLRDFAERFSDIQLLEIPPNSKIPQYFLIFATNRPHIADGMRKSMDNIRVQFHKLKKGLLKKQSS